MDKITAKKNIKPGVPPVMWTPQVIYSDRKLSSDAKLILSEILNLLKLDRRYCWATNTHFSDMFGMGIKKVSYHIQQMEKSGWVKSDFVKICKLGDCPLMDKGNHRHIYPGRTLSNILDSLAGVETATQTPPLTPNLGKGSPQILESLIPNLGKVVYETNIETKSKEIVNKLTRPKAETEVQVLEETPLKGKKRNVEIDQVLECLKTSLGLPALDLSVKVNRQYAWNLLRKSRTGAEGVCWLIRLAAEDPWFRNHITSMRDLWNNQVKIMSSVRGKKKEVAVYGMDS
jgi:hypothetical protein